MTERETICAVELRILKRLRRNLFKCECGWPEADCAKHHPQGKALADGERAKEGE